MSSMGNIEIKARVKDMDRIKELAKKISDTPAELITQKDTFYNVNNGRLKMRIFADESGVLVRYNRDNVLGPKVSNYDLVEFDEMKAKEMHSLLSNCLGVKGTLSKKRTLYMVGPTRIHIDVVEGLGNFMELEVVLGSNLSHEEGIKIALDIQNKLEVKDEDLIECAYIDLL